MKEYIPKEDMTISLNHNGGIFKIEIPFSKMDGLKTVTKADIRAEVINEIRKEFNDYCGMQRHLISEGVWNILDKVAEMEKE